MLIHPSLWIWIPLLLAVIVGFQKRLLLTFSLLALSLVGAWFTERLSSLAFLYVSLGLILAYYTPSLAKRWQTVAQCTLLVWCGLLLLHIIPGFENPKVLDGVLAGPNSVPFNLYLNLDKPMVFFALLLAYPTLLGHQQRIPWRQVVLLSLPLFSLLLLAWGFGAIKPELTLPTWWWLFALNNALLTCVAEEAFFRGYLQQKITDKWGFSLGIIIASSLFGLAHLAGGVTLALFATLAGAFYGAIYYCSGRLWVAVLLHFLFNFIHLIFFTYPVAMKISI
ncbi:CPBP family intramembrane glutamic endopeptidase [Vibrio metschnikovii]|uniref:CPBP family intramembrane glutamic endopeptidase n=1 Tax=Vibrio metschnikovii TaxID=28172 RepID=UPI0001B94B36|nr:CPBP family intramembrane glutamic endopeptidase [Vibrio metschnikovii]EEX36362.1 CAAX amino terminal protease family [Vibrio metschnikovii CIP 69.14]